MRIHKSNRIETTRRDATRSDDAMDEALALVPINNLLGAVAMEWN
jgi:hypothetical protein